MRLDKYLTHVGYGSRNEVGQLIKKKKVKVNGEVVVKPNHNVKEASDEVSVAGNIISYKEFYYFVMNKPGDVITATKDNQHQTVIDLLEPIDRNKDVSPVGRLDKDTEGLLILTNDGKFNHALMSPKKHVQKVYYAEVEGELIEEAEDLFANGMELRDGTVFQPAKLEVIERGQLTKVYVTLLEGKFHQVKRMIARCGGDVVFLKRIAMGGLSLPDNIACGEYRELTDEEMKSLQGDL